MIRLELTDGVANLESNHSDGYINSVKEKSERLGENENVIDSANDVYFDKNTFVTARKSADACISAVNKVLDIDSPLERGFCIVRPPGHHSKKDHYSGFCFFNNVALAA